MTCARCDKPTKKGRNKYCSKECQYEGLKGERVPRPNCKRCGKRCEQIKAVYCSEECFRLSLVWGKPVRAGAWARGRAAYCFINRRTPTSCFLVQQFKAGDTLPSYNPASGLVRFLTYADESVELYQDFQGLDSYENTGSFMIGSRKAVALC